MVSDRPIVFATLGPSGTNHELVTRRYIDFHKIDAAEVVLVEDFNSAIDRLTAGEVDYVIQCAVHPDTPRTLGANFRDVFAVDAFISSSKDLAIVTRNDVSIPKSIGIVLPSTEKYVDLSRWSKVHAGPSIPVVFDNLLKGSYDSALVYREYADRYPDRVQIDDVIGSPDDVWIVYGRERASKGGLLAWPESAVGRKVKSRM